MQRASLATVSVFNDGTDGFTANDTGDVAEVPEFEDPNLEAVVSKGQAGLLENGESRFGGWATSDAVPDQAFARNNLAILTEFKADVSMIVQVETTAPQTLNRGIVGPLGSASGGASQVEFIGGRNLRLVGSPQSLSAVGE